MAFSVTRRSYNKTRQLIWLLSVVILIDMQVVISYYKNMINLIHHIYHSSHLLGHIMSLYLIACDVYHVLHLICLERR